MRTYFPEIEPYKTYFLEVNQGHKIYVEECGNPEGLPVVFLHGGPGVGCSADHRRYFDPEKFRVILWDQRGAGRSQFEERLRGNTTEALLEDMETLREASGVEQWLVCGGSWGSTLALVYGQTHPDRVLGFLLRGIFLSRPQDYQWLYQQGAPAVYPDAWEHVQALLPEGMGLVKGYQALLQSESQKERLEAARAWSRWEFLCGVLRPNLEAIESLLQNETLVLGFSEISLHYFAHDCFLSDYDILSHMHRIAHLPAVITHGRYDMVCALDNAWSLQKAWPLAALHIIPEAGHAGSEPGTVDATIRGAELLFEKVQS